MTYEELRELAVELAHRLVQAERMTEYYQRQLADKDRLLAECRTAADDSDMRFSVIASYDAAADK